jgi:hypothetical protein
LYISSSAGANSAERESTSFFLFRDLLGVADRKRVEQMHQVGMPDLVDRRLGRVVHYNVNDPAVAARVDAVGRPQKVEQNLEFLIQRAVGGLAQIAAGPE